MEDPNSTLLPYILELLSCKPDYCDTFDNLCSEVQEQLMREKKSIHGNVKTAIKRALNVGQSLGIISLTHEVIRVPFSFVNQKARGKQSAPDTKQRQQKQMTVRKVVSASGTGKQSKSNLQKTQAKRDGVNRVESQESTNSGTSDSNGGGASLRWRSRSRNKSAKRKYSKVHRSKSARMFSPKRVSRRR